MYYVARGSIPRQRHTQHRARRRQPVRGGAVRGRGLHRSQLAPLPPDAADADAPDRAGPPDRARGGRRRAPPPSADEDRRRSSRAATSSPAGSRCTSTTTSSSGSSGRRGRCRTASSTGTASPTRCCSSMRARASATRSSATSATARATTSSCRSGRPGGSTRTRAASSGSSTSRRPRRSSRRSATGTTTASCSSTRRTASATSTRRSSGSRAPEDGEFVIHVRSADRITAYHYRHHPFDVVGWDGYLWPFRFDIADFQPITGRVHQPPPVHQTFQARNFVVCSFVPRKFDYHPLAIPAPYNHSNINSDEVIYYVAGNFMSRRGVDIASFTAPPGRDPARPAPGDGRGVDRQGARPKSSPSWSTRSIRCPSPRRRSSSTTRLPVSLAAAGGRRAGSLRARGARPGGVPGLRSAARCWVCGARGGCCRGLRSTWEGCLLGRGGQPRRDLRERR